MEDIYFHWTFEESLDELRNKLENTLHELEMTKKEANNEKMKNNEKINKLLHLIQTAFNQRDEAKSQLTKLQQSLPPFSPNTPLLYPNYPTKSNSDSNTNPHSPVADSPPPAFPDRGTLVIQQLAVGRPLPPKGNLMEAVKKAGPLLETLLMAGSLPRWRNPPQLMTHPIPRVNIHGGLYSSSYMVDFGSGSSSKRQRFL